MGTGNTIVTRFDAEALNNAITKSGISRKNIATMVLKRDQSYISNACKKGTINPSDLRKLCEFLSLDYNMVVIMEKPKAEVVPTKEKAQAADNKLLETLIISLNSLLETEKQNQKLLGEILQEVKVNNTKTNRLENAMGQMVSSTLVVKEAVTGDLMNYVRDTKSSTATISGRVKDLLNELK